MLERRRQSLGVRGDTRVSPQGWQGDGDEGLICAGHPQGRPGMNGMKGEKGDPADVSSVLGLRVSLAPQTAGPAEQGAHAEGLPGDPDPCGKEHMPPSLPLWGMAWLWCPCQGGCPLCRTLAQLFSPFRVRRDPQGPQGPRAHLAA